MNQWHKVYDDTWMKQNSDGTWSARKVQNVKKSMEAKRRMRLEATKNPRESRSKDGEVQSVASIPSVYEVEMNLTCGNDPEKKDMFLRDHPELLLAPKKQTNLPPVRSYFSFPNNPLAKK